MDGYCLLAPCGLHENATENFSELALRMLGSRLMRLSGYGRNMNRSTLLSTNPCARAYHETVHDHFNNPRNVGKMDKSDPKVGTAIVGKAACGDVVQLQIKVEDGVITDAKFKTFGCGSAIASASYATELIKGKSADEASAPVAEEAPAPVKKAAAKKAPKAEASSEAAASEDAAPAEVVKPKAANKTAAKKA